MTVTLLFQSTERESVRKARDMDTKQYSNESITTTEERNVARGVLVWAVVIAMAWVGLNLIQADAHADHDGPHGYDPRSCYNTWHATGSEVDKTCRERGWVIRPRLVISPNKRVKAMSLPPCKFEDSRNCYWNAKRMGTGHGRSLVHLKGHTYFVRGFAPGTQR